MSPQDFCYWLQGHFELNGGTGMSERQGAIIKKQLALVFTKVAPTPPTPFSPRFPELRHQRQVTPDMIITCSEIPKVENAPTVEFPRQQPTHCDVTGAALPGQQKLR